MENIEKLLSEVRRYVDKDLQIRNEKAKRGEYFNIFKVLGLSSNETRTHSAFIAELLNPEGSHDCGGAFLKAFVESVLQKPFNPEELENAKVDVEKSIGFKNEDVSEGGRIDIKITIGMTLIIIENKIHARDQEKQLIRYRKYALDLEKDNEIKEFLLLYLTLFGNEASKLSTDGRLKQSEDYKTISYSRDILNWLECCKEKSVGKPLVRETIKQYINLIKELTNQNMEEMQNEQILAEMVLYPEAAAAILNVGFAEFRNSLYKKYCEPKFKEEAEKRKLIYDGSCACTGKKESGFHFPLKKEEPSSICIWTERTDRDYFIGISFYNVDENKIKDVSPHRILGKPTIWWPIGTKYLGKSMDWDNPSIITAFTSGKYVMNIMKEVDEILKEMKNQNIKLL